MLTEKTMTATPVDSFSDSQHPSQQGAADKAGFIADRKTLQVGLDDTLGKPGAF